KDLPRTNGFDCGVYEKDHTISSVSSEPAHNVQYRSTGSQLKTYRLALACTGEYAATKGGTVSGALSGMVTSVNRVSGIFEQEVGVRMEIIENDTVLIYLNSSSDGYDNFDGMAMLDQNQTKCDNLIGSAN